jgi:hypothetical protein
MAIRKSSSSGIPFGNTAGRPAAPGTGQLYSNGQLGRLELYTETGWQNIVQETPGIASITGTYNESAGSGTFTISGTNFVTGGLVYAVGTNAVEYQATTSTTNSIVQMTAVFTGLSPAYEPYDVKVINPSNLFGLLPDAFYINDSPVWSTSSGSLGTYNGSSIQLAATDDESNTITYSVTAGSLPTGLSLSSAGLISGTNTTSPGTYTFTVSASDGVNTVVTRSFSINAPFPTISGGTLTSDSTYYYRTFTSSSNLIVSANTLNCNYLVVAGGGGAGGCGLNNSATGGGGAGGYLSGTTTLSQLTYAITVGSGGSGGPAKDSSMLNDSEATIGQNSQFASIATATGGGASPNSNAIYNGVLRNGGSGAGGTGNPNSSTGFPGTGISGQGNNGGAASYGQNGGFYSGGGGGGAGAAGENASLNSTTAGAGGVGVQWVNGSYYAGGGAGGTYNSSSFVSGGNGGGGSGGGNGTTIGGNGAPNTGGGGGAVGGGTGGGKINLTGGNGGSGIVIVRYTKASVGG